MSQPYLVDHHQNSFTWHGLDIFIFIIYIRSVNPAKIGCPCLVRHPKNMPSFSGLAIFIFMFYHTSSQTSFCKGVRTCYVKDIPRIPGMLSFTFLDIYQYHRLCHIDQSTGTFTTSTELVVTGLSSYIHHLLQRHIRHVRTC